MPPSVIPAEAGIHPPSESPRAPSESPAQAGAPAYNALMDSSTRILIGVVAGVILLVVLAIALSRLIDDQEAQYSPDSPEGTVQRYIRAAIDEDPETAIALLTEHNKTDCALRELRERMGHSSARVRPIPSALDRYRVRLGNVEEIDPETVTVNVGTTYIGEPDLFEIPNQGNTAEYEFELRRSPDGFWLIEESEWPHELKYIREYGCRDEPTRAPPPTPQVAGS